MAPLCGTKAKGLASGIPRNFMRLIRCFREKRPQLAFDPTIEPEIALTASPCGPGTSPPMLVNILGITDDAKCYELVRQLR